VCVCVCVCVCEVVYSLYTPRRFTGESQGSHRGVTGETHGSHRGVTGMSQGRESHGSYRGVSAESQGCHRGDIWGFTKYMYTGHTDMHICEAAVGGNKDKTKAWQK
jgi:hypothetical protein